MDTGLIDSIELLHPSSELLGYSHQAPTGLTSTPCTTARRIQVASGTPGTLVGEIAWTCSEW